MPDKNFEENQINDYEKQKLFEKSNSFGNKKNFSKTLAASLAVLNLFAGNFAKAVKNSATDKSVNTKSKDSSVDSKKIIEKKNQMFNNFQNEWLTKKNAAFATVAACALAFACKAEKDNRKLTESNQELLKTNEELSKSKNSLVANASRWLKSLKSIIEAESKMKKDFLVEGLRIALEIQKQLLSEIDFEELGQNSKKITIKNTKIALDIHCKEANNIMFDRHYEGNVAFQGNGNEEKTAAEVLGDIRELFCLFASMLDKFGIKYLKENGYKSGLDVLPLFLRSVRLKDLQKIKFTGGKNEKIKKKNENFFKTFEFINGEKISEYLTTAIEKLNNAPQNENDTVDLSMMV